MDREGQDAFDLLDEIENKLKIKVRPLSWPIGIGVTFKGVYNMHKGHLNSAALQTDQFGLTNMDLPLGLTTGSLWRTSAPGSAGR